MRLNEAVSIQVLSRRTMLKPSDFIARLILHHEMLSHMIPIKWGWWEPVKKVWDISDPAVFIPVDRGGNADNVIWTRGIKPKAEGAFNVSNKPADLNALRGHATERLHCELRQFVQRPIVDYIQQSMILVDGDIAFIHYVAEKEKLIRFWETKYEGAYIDTVDMRLVTATLRHWLPELPWAVVFGQAYVRMFGLERLLAAPAYVVKKLSDEAVYLQLSPKLTDLVDDYAAVDAVRQAVKDHLGRDAFFDVTKAYPLRGPVNERGIYTPKEILNFKPPPPIGTVFRVPDFHLIED